MRPPRCSARSKTAPPGAFASRGIPGGAPAAGAARKWRHDFLPGLCVVVGSLLPSGCTRIGPDSASRDEDSAAMAVAPAAAVAAWTGSDGEVRRLFPGSPAPLAAHWTWSSGQPLALPTLRSKHPVDRRPPDFSASFDGASDLAAFRFCSDARFGRQIDAAVDPATVEPGSLADGRLVLPQRASAAACVLPAAPLTPYVVELTLGHALADEIRLHVVDFTEPFVGAATPDELLARIVRAGAVEALREASWNAAPTKDPAVLARRLEPEVAPAGDGAVRWRVTLQAHWRTRALGFVVSGTTAGPSWIDDFTVHELGAADVLALGPGGPENFDLPRPWRNLDPERPITKVRCEWETRRALLMQSGGAVRCEFTAPAKSEASPGRLEIGLALVREERCCVEGPRESLARVTFNGRVLDVPVRLRFDAPDGWQELVLPLPAGGGPCVLKVEYVDPDRSRAAASDSPSSLLPTPRPTPLLALSDPLLFIAESATPAAAPPSGANVRNVVLLSLDTFRADRLGRRRPDGRSLTPRLDALAARSAVFTQALSNSSYTLPAHVSLFTSQRPGEHGMLSVFDQLEPAVSPLLARCLAEQGHATAAFTSGGMLNTVFCAIDEGFDRFGEIDPILTAGDRLRDIAPLQQRPGYNRELATRRRLEKDVLPWLAAHRATPFLLFLHSYLTHNYQPEPELLAEFTRGLPPTPLDLARVVPHLGCDAKTGAPLLDGAPFVAARDLPWLEARYDATVAQADREVGRLLDQLDAMGLTDQTIVIVTSDHGEEFLEHGDLSHAHSLYDEILRVPLLIHVPGMAPRVVAEPVELIDIAPTVLGRLGLTVDPRMRGSDLLDPGHEPRAITLHEGTGAFTRPRSAGVHTRRAARTRDGKLIVAAPLGAVGDAALSAAMYTQLNCFGYAEGGTALAESLDAKFFDLATDPGERRDLALAEWTREQRIRLQALAAELAREPFLGARSR